MNINAIAANLLHVYSMVLDNYIPQLEGRFCKGRITALFMDDDTAPEDLHSLQAELRKGRFPVPLRHADSTIYGGRYPNAIFRLFHDAGHALYDREMTYADEVVLAAQQWADLCPKLVAVLNDQYMRVPAGVLRQHMMVYLAETVGQSEFCEQHGRFPEDQNTFVHDLATHLYSTEEGDIAGITWSIAAWVEANKYYR